MFCSVCQLPIAEAIARSESRPNERECPFCLAIFSRADGARRHAKNCTQRAGRTLHPGKRGRKALSCDRCSRVKVHCNAWAQTPCNGCATRKLACTFSRYCINITHRCPADKTSADFPPRNIDRVSLAFLLNSTDDKQDFVTEKALGKEPDGALLGPIGVTSPQARVLNGETLDFIDPTLLLPSSCPAGFMPLELDVLWSTEEENLVDTFLSFRNHENRLAGRIDLLESHVAAHACSSNHYRHSFDRSAFRRLFSVSNVYTFAKTFCRKRHYQYPIIHWPTFALEEASLPLLMVISLTGASYSYRPGHEPEHIHNARNYYRLADSYVFDQLNACIDRIPSDISITEAVQLLQAALLMYGLDNLLTSDAAMQQLTIAVRLPALVSAMRRLNFVGCRHDVSEDWQLFLHREQIIRLVCWTFCADCLATLSYNNPPLFSMLELTGDLPCDPVLWDTESALGFELGSSQKQPSYRLKDLISSFFNDDTEQDFERENLPLFHLHVALCGFQQIIFNLHVAMVLTKQLEKMQQALKTWRHLWERAMDRIPSDHRSWLGVARYVPGIEHLSRRVIEVAVSPEAGSSQYLQRTPSHSTRDLHDFIKDFVSQS